MSVQSESGIHASQVAIPMTAATESGPQDGGLQAQKAKKSKLQLWNDLKISCKFGNNPIIGPVTNLLQLSLAHSLWSTPLLCSPSLLAFN